MLSLSHFLLLSLYKMVPFLLSLVDGSQNMCMSSDVSVTKDNSLRWQKNCQKGGGEEEVLVAVTARLDKKNSSARQEGGQDRRPASWPGDPARRAGAREKHACPLQAHTALTGTPNKKTPGEYRTSLSPCFPTCLALSSRLCAKPIASAISISLSEKKGKQNHGA